MEQFEFFSVKIEKKLRKYEEIIKKWQKSVNLVSRNDVLNIWVRHIVDSAQLYPFLDGLGYSVVDMGSGAGFPGLVLAIIDQEKKGGRYFTLIESDKKKVLFLEEVVRLLKLQNVTVSCQRIEKISIPIVDVVLARGLASLADLISLSKHFWGVSTHGLFLKGKGVYLEMSSIPSCFECQNYPSKTSKDGVIVNMFFKNKG